MIFIFIFIDSSYFCQFVIQIEDLNLFCYGLIAEFISSNAKYLEAFYGYQVCFFIVIQKIIMMFDLFNYYSDYLVKQF